MSLSNHIPSAETTVTVDTPDVDPRRARDIERRLRDLVLRGSRVIVVRLERKADVNAFLAGALLRVQHSLEWRNGRLVVAADEAVGKRLALMGLSDHLEVVEWRSRGHT